MAISRHGVNRSESGPMLRASFERTVEVFMEAASFSQYDYLNGVTENVMLGQLGRLGTGMVDLYVDYQKLENAMDTIDNSENIMSDAIKPYGSYMDMKTPMATPAATPYGGGTPGYLGYGGLGGATPLLGSFSPAVGGETPGFGGRTPAYMQSPGPYGGYAGAQRFVGRLPLITMLKPSTVRVCSSQACIPLEVLMALLPRLIDPQGRIPLTMLLPSLTMNE